MPLRLLSVKVSFIDGDIKKYVDVEKVSVGREWIFLKFIDGGRKQIPAVNIKEIQEDEGVYVKGNRYDNPSNPRQ